MQIKHEVQLVDNCYVHVRLTVSTKALLCRISKITKYIFQSSWMNLMKYNYLYLGNNIETNYLLICKKFQLIL